MTAAVCEVLKSQNSSTTETAHGHREPQREGAAALAVFEFVVHGPEADQRVVDRVPDGSDGQDHARDEHVDLQYIGEENR